MLAISLAEAPKLDALREALQEGKGRERAAETGRSSRGERTIAELSACRYDEYAELRS